jgi:hypothetical protein
MALILLALWLITFISLVPLLAQEGIIHNIATFIIALLMYPLIVVGIIIISIFYLLNRGGK